MSIYQLRTYAMRDRASLDHYRKGIYPRHLKSFPACNITPHGFWTSPDEPLSPFVLVSYADGADLEEIEKEYMQSPGFLADMEGMDTSAIVGVTAVVLEPSAGSPLT
ncbi:NIPSNAP family protein [Nocardia asiatica]|uniref:NIPSNAP family protein n=1 Tax=Nocardia asiatica TaxID=209252 RepID=UPI0002E2E215|nr:NIPSNAP family protein [Nocardia asiatica]